MNRRSTGYHRAAALMGQLLALAIIVAGCSANGDSGGTPNVPVPSAAQGSPNASVPVVPTQPWASTTPATSAPTLVPTAVPPQYAWLATDLRDVRTGETIHPADLLGKLVVIEPMAAWCSNCRAQQDEVRSALANINSANLVYVSLDVDPNETESDLARYADDRGYAWHFAVASRELARALAATFGDVVLSPPSTPKIVIKPDGTADVSYGIKSAADLEAELIALLP
ncbi:MAG: hypothetical protein ABI725_04700 [Chloroflexota bacterium]